MQNYGSKFEGNGKIRRSYAVTFRFLLLFFTFSFLFFNFTSVEAATYYVATNGSDSGAGTITAPFKTVQKGVDVARAGDTVYVRAGTYFESITMSYSGSAGNPITLSGYPGERPVINFQASEINRIYRQILLQAYEGYQRPIGWIVIQNFELINGTAGIKMYNAHDTIIRGNIIHDSVGNGILGNGYKVTFDGNLVYHNGYENGQPSTTSNGPNVVYSMYFSGTYINVTNNIFHSNTGYGMQIAGYGYVSTEHAGPEYATAKYWLIANNVIAKNGWGGAVSWNAYNNGSASYNNYQNNIFYDNALTVASWDARGQGLDFYNSDGNNTVSNNIGWSSRGLPMLSAYPGTLSSYYTGSNNIDNTNPQFLNPSGSNFHLTSDSPAINTGLTIGSITTDFDGITRPQGSAYDIGAYEYVSATTPPPLLGDINQDRIVNSLDWSLMSAKWLTSDTSADLNKDGAVNSLDWSIMSGNWLKTG